VKFCAEKEGSDIFVMDQDGSRIASIPLLAHKESTVIRSESERWNIAWHISRLMDAESEACHADAEAAWTVAAYTPPGAAPDHQNRAFGRNSSRERADLND
jgi:hypothetical protein